MSNPGWLIDKSALVRLGHCRDQDVWVERIERGLIHISSVTLLEVGYSARSAQALQYERSNPPIASMPLEYSTPTIEDQALNVQATLATHGHHRAPSVADLLIAATAEMTGLIVLHADKDFELIAEVTGQTVQRLSE